MKILVTGATGFLGKHLVKELENRGYEVDGIGSEFDLRDLEEARKATFGHELIIHLAASVGGISSNIKKPGDYFRDNALMGINIIDAARLNGASKLVCVGSVCSYSDTIDVPFKEGDFWQGYPEESNAAYGMAKKIALPMLRAYRKQYGFNGVYPVLTNLYGPGDRSDHVIPDLFRKFRRATGDVTLWGSGKQTRDFLYVADAARGIVDVLEHYDDPEPINLSTGVATSIRELAEKIAAITDFEHDIHWDTSKPEGHSQRVVSPEKAGRVLGWEPAYDIYQGLQETE